jgi:hypothetical protein
MEIFANCAGAIQNDEVKEPAEPNPPSCRTTVGENTPDNRALTDEILQNPECDAFIWLS